MLGGGDVLNAVFRFCAHLGVFGVLGVLVYAALHHAFTFRRSPFVTALFITLLLGALDELHQAFVPGRFARFQDVCTDMVGAAFAIVCVCAFFRHQRLGSPIARSQTSNAPQ
jgi:VanZ family protein